MPDDGGNAMTMFEDVRQAKINAYIDGWMIKLNDRAKDYQERGLDAEEALDRATFDIRMEIRRAPPVVLE
jgi:hypothetical protein